LPLTATDAAVPMLLICRLHARQSNPKLTGQLESVPGLKAEKQVMR
jgi:hypothetical protein